MKAEVAHQCNRADPATKSNITLRCTSKVFPAMGDKFQWQTELSIDSLLILQHTALNLTWTCSIVWYEFCSWMSQSLSVVLLFVFIFALVFLTKSQAQNILHKQWINHLLQVKSARSIL